MAKGPSPLARLNTPAKIGVGAALVALTGIVYWVVFYGDLATSITAAQKQEQQLKSILADARKAEDAYQKDLEELTACYRS